ncbi:MAG: gas vesicle protein [Chloroflexaceae bacterium]|nr:gas vesicle protein [Chloroflexaceae bacterium]
MHNPNRAAPDKDLVLLDLLDRALDKGVVLSGELVISVADVDLIYIGLKVLLTSVDTLQNMSTDAPLESLNTPPESQL